MNRRQFVTSSIGTVALSSLAGCASSEPTGRNYALTITDRNVEADRVLDFDRSGLAAGQRRIVETAIREGVYAEGTVSWNTIPGREPISMEFKMLLQLIARHTGNDPNFGEPIEFDTPSRYDREAYRTAVDVELPDS